MLDKVVATIRNAESREQAKEKLTQLYNLSEKQLSAILDMRLAQLTGLEREKILAEHTQILEMIANLQNILANPEIVKEIVKQELEGIKASHNDARRTEITPELGEFNLASLIPPADVFITFSMAGYLKRVNLDEFRVQNRAGKGKTGASLKENDLVKFTFNAHTHDNLLMFSNLGKIYSFKVYELPEALATGKGKSINQLLVLAENEKITVMLPVKEFTDNQYVLMVTKQGVIKKTELSAFSNVRSSGIRAVTLEDDDTLVAVKITSGKDEIIMATAHGKSIRFSEEDVRNMGRSAKGVKGIELDIAEKDYVVAAEIVKPDESILVVTANGYGKRSKIDEYRLQSRGGKGVKTIKVTQRNGDVIGLISVNNDADIMFTTDSGRVLRILVNSMRIMGRVTQGVCLMKILSGERIASLSQPSEFDDTPITQIEALEEDE